MNIFFYLLIPIVITGVMVLLVVNFTNKKKKQLAAAGEDPLHGLYGIGGWLYIIAIDLIQMPGSFAVVLYEKYAFTLTDEFLILSAPGTEFSTQGFILLMNYMIVSLVIFMMLYVYLFFIFIKKKKAFPKLYILIKITYIISTLIIIYMAKSVFPSMDVFDKETIKDIAQEVVTLLIWGSYMLVSRRVQATFIH